MLVMRMSITVSYVETQLAKFHFARGSLNGYRHAAESQPTLEMVNGVLKSRPPTSRKPQGEGPFSVTVWGMFGKKDCEGETDR